MNFLNICFFVLLPRSNAFEMVENGRLDISSLPYNKSCDDLEIGKLCETNCGDIFKDCSRDCDSQG